MSNQDSFITEVTEEVRRDRLFALLRRYGWIAALLVVVLVAGAAFNEWRKSTARAEAEAAGDAMIAALEAETAEERSAALASVGPFEDAGKQAVLKLLQAASATESGDGATAIEALRSVAGDDDVPQVYRDLALLKLAMVGSEEMSPDERISQLQPLMQPGNPLRLLAIEQRALAEVEMGEKDAAIETLRSILADAEATEGLRRRAQQLIVALGGSIEQS